MTNQALVELLASRGLGGQPSDVLRSLETVGYFRLKGYLFPLLKKDADVQRLVADAFHVPPNALGGILNLLRRARNVCAHHSRFWNRRINAGVSSGLGNAPEIAPFEECLRSASEQGGTSAFVTLSRVAYCMSVFRPESEWKNRCRDFLAARDTFVLRGMGFPADWQALALWK